MRNIKTCPFCGADYPSCGPECYNYKIAELAMLHMGKRGGRDVPLRELELAWDTRTDTKADKLAGLLLEVRPFVDHADSQFIDYPDALNERIDKSLATHNAEKKGTT